MDVRTLVIFDIDGTLLYSNKIDSQCFADTYQRRYQRPFPTIDWTHFPHVVDTTIFATVIRDQFGREPEEAEVIDFQEEFVALLEEKRRLNPGDFQEVPKAKDCIEQLLVNPQYRVGIATGGWQRPAMVKLRHVGIPTAPLLISCADGKVSREEILQEVIDGANKEPGEIERIVYIGDAIWDVQTTRNMQLPFIGLRREGDHQHLLEAGAQAVLSDYRDYDQFLKLIAEVETPVWIE